MDAFGAQNSELTDAEIISELKEYSGQILTPGKENRDPYSGMEISFSGCISKDGGNRLFDREKYFLDEERRIEIVPCSSEVKSLLEKGTETEIELEAEVEINYEMTPSGLNSSTPVQRYQLRVLGASI